MDNKENGFCFKYSAGEQEEIRKIRERYEKKQDGEDKLERIRRLDRSVTMKAQAFALCFGIIGALVLGFGMSLVMSELASQMGMTLGGAMAVGISSGLVGGVLVALAYPVYSLVIRRERERVAPELIALADELLK